MPTEVARWAKNEKRLKIANPFSFVFHLQGILKVTMDAIGPILRSLYIILGGYLGFLLGSFLSKQFTGFAYPNSWYLGCAMALTTFLFAAKLEEFTKVVFRQAKNWSTQLEPRKVTAFAIGAIAALLLSVLLNNILQGSVFDNLFIKIFTTVGLGGFFTFFTVQNSEFFGMMAQVPPPTLPVLPALPKHQNPKILDTNVIIDGRITDLASSGFLEGTLLVPVFVLRELQFIADQGDTTKRARGRRGLEVLEALKGMQPLEIIDWDAPDLSSVDDKLIRLAKEIGGKLVSNDYNLGKVAKLQEVSVLSLNELALAIKPKFAAGDLMSIIVTNEGKQAGQGVGYLEDGTMVVVDGGLAFRGKPRRVVVQSNIQTAMGRMIFAKLDDE
jgi:uncharacterized protein YacL